MGSLKLLGYPTLYPSYTQYAPSELNLFERFGLTAPGDACAPCRTGQILEGRMCLSTEPGHCLLITYLESPQLIQESPSGTDTKLQPKPSVQSPG